MDKWFTGCWSGRAVLLTVLLIACAHGQSKQNNATQDNSHNSSDVQFIALDVMADCGETPLAAYQFELEADAKQVHIVGIEGGDHQAFSEPPFYDPAALSQNRIIVAAFSTAKELPQGMQRIARVHLQIDADVDPAYTTKLVTAASSDGKRISPQITVVAANEDAAKGASR